MDHYPRDGSDLHDQGVYVYYLCTVEGRHLLLPQRLSRFERLLELVQGRSGVDVTGAGRLIPLWTYLALALLSG